MGESDNVISEELDKMEEEENHIGEGVRNSLEDEEVPDSPLRLAKHPKKRAVFDSDSDESDTKTSTNSTDKKLQQNQISEAEKGSDLELNDNSLDDVLPKSSGKARRKIIVHDSDSDSDDPVGTRSLSPLSNVEVTSQAKHTIVSKKQSRSPLKKRNISNDSESDDDKHSSSSNKTDESDTDLLDIPPPSRKSQPPTADQVFQNSDVYDAGSSSDDDNPKARDAYNSSASSDSGSKSNTKSKKKNIKDKRPPQRKASEKAREKTVQELASKTQKLARESRVSLPYSRPTQMTLDEFLKKRKEAKKTILSTLIASPALGTLRKGIKLDDDVEETNVTCISPDSNKVESILTRESHDGEDNNVIANDSFGQDETGVDAITSTENGTLNIISVATQQQQTLRATQEKVSEIGNLLCATKVDEVVDTAAAEKTTNTSSVENPTSKMEVSSALADEDEEVIEKSTNTEEIVEIHQEKESELDAYLESLKPKPKRKSIKEMLMSLPEYKNLATLKPKIGGGQKQSVIDLDIGNDKRKSAKDIKRQQQIEELKDRFVRHAMPAPQKQTKGEHVKLRIKKKEEDSQGIEHLVENEVDYIRNPLNDDDEAVNFLAEKDSPKAAQAPGAQRRRLQEMLMGKMRTHRIKEHRERQKAFDMYNEEKDVDEKGDDDQLENEEIIEDCSEDDSEVDDEDEELEYLLSATKKNKKKSAFVEDEAEDEDGDDDNDDGDDDSDDDDDDEDDDLEVSDEYNELENKNDPQQIENEDLEDCIATADDSIPAAQITSNRVVDPVLKPLDEESQEVAFNANVTPKVTAAVLNHRTPSDFWIPAKTNANSRHSDELSPLIPRIPETKNQEYKSNVPAALSNVIAEPETRFDDLVELCSGRFVSQINTGVSDSQEDSEFGNFDFGDDELCENNTKEADDCVSTPANIGSRTAVDGITPKLSEKVPKTRLLMQFNEEAERDDAEKDQQTSDVEGQKESTKTIVSDDDEEEEIIANRVRAGKKKRLQFSDDEDDSNVQNQSDNDVSDEEELETENIPPAEEKLKPNLFFNKHGRMKRKFVEDEAELSGSEEGSGDEDEKGLNHYEMEEGDEEEIDEAVVRNQVERAHLKQLLDDDDREIRFLQNTYLEDGDLHSDQQRKERKFRWTLDMNALDDDANMGDSDGDEPEENPEEASKRVAWLEKRKWLSENSHLLESEVDESQSLFNNSRILRVTKSTLKRIESFADTSTSESKDLIIKESTNQKRSIYDEIIKAKAAAKAVNGLTSCSEGFDLALTETDSSSKSMSQPLCSEASWTKTLPALKKGSFLSRGGVMLAKLAETTKAGDPVSNVKSNSRNFVFSHVTPPNPEKKVASKVKRTTANSGKCGVQAKKIKVDRSFNNLDEASKDASIFKWL